MTQADEHSDHPLAFGGAVPPAGQDGFECFLTPEIAREWLINGVPECRTLVRRHALGKWRMMDRFDPTTPEDGFIGAFRARDQFLNEIAFGLPCKEAIDAIVAGGPLVECGAGTGFWAALLANAGADIRACDSPAGTHYGFSPASFFPCVPADAEDFVRTNPARNVLMVWPCYKADWAARAAHAMQPGRTLWLVSEGQGGCVGDDNLFRVLDQNFEELDTIYLPVWPSIGDRMEVFVKRL